MWGMTRAPSDLEVGLDRKTLSSSASQVALWVGDLGGYYERPDRTGPGY